jgi:FAH family protein
MELITFKKNSEKNRQILGVIGDDGSVFSFMQVGINFNDMLDFVQNYTQNDLQNLEYFSQKTGGIARDEIEILAPMTRANGDIICLGINYFAHAQESYKFKNKEFDGKREHAVYFAKRATFINGSGAKINGHFDVTNSLDYEAELAIIIGKDAKNVSAKDAKDYIFGYTIFNDFSARDLQNRHKQWYFGKSLDGFCAMGPLIQTQLKSRNLAIKSYVNGELRQNANTSEMIFDEYQIIAELSNAMTLKAGTIISLGTPSGVGMGFNPPKFLKSGDKVVCEIESLGRLENEII